MSAAELSQAIERIAREMREGLDQAAVEIGAVEARIERLDAENESLRRNLELARSREVSARLQLARARYELAAAERVIAELRAREEA